jgi:hypothetical protein
MTRERDPTTGLRCGFTVAGDAWGGREDQGYPDRASAKAFYAEAREEGFSAQEIRIAWCNAEGDPVRARLFLGQRN